MARSRYALTPAVSQLIVSYVRAGGNARLIHSKRGFMRVLPCRMCLSLHRAI